MFHVVYLCWMLTNKTVLIPLLRELSNNGKVRIALELNSVVRTKEEGDGQSPNPLFVPALSVSAGCKKRRTLFPERRWRRGPGDRDGSPGDVEPTCAHRTSSCGRWARAQARGAIEVSDLSGVRAGHQLWAR